MADTIKIGNLDISSFKVGSDDCKVYLGDTLLYSGGTTPPTPFDGKWLATYSDSHTESAECDSTSAITSNEITKVGVETIEIGDCVTTIGDNALQNCESLTNITIPNSVTSINQYAIRNCVSLTSCTIGSGVTNIGRRAFQNCPSLTSFFCLATVPPNLGASAFLSTDNCIIYVPAASVNAYKAKSGWSSYASRIQAIPNS